MEMEKKSRIDIFMRWLKCARDVTRVLDFAIAHKPWIIAASATFQHWLAHLTHAVG